VKAVLQLLGIVACGLAAARSGADDGRIEINAACPAIGCFAGDTPGYPVTITAPGSYQLTSDLALPAATSGVVFQADDVHFDLNGFSIRGPASCAPGACSAAGSLVGVGRAGGGTPGRRCSVRGGSIVGIDGTGIRLSIASRVERMLVASVTSIGIQMLRPGAYVRDSSVNSVGTGGIEVLPAAIVQNNVVTQVGLRAAGAPSIWEVPGQGNACDDGRCTRFRRYYVSKTPADGANATFACATGFHMAALWEIHDTAQLSYDTTLGAVAADSGAGPPIAYAWVRTSNAPQVVANAPGYSNCAAWTSASMSHYGTLASLPENWGVVEPTPSAGVSHCAVWTTADPSRAGVSRS